MQQDVTSILKNAKRLHFVGIGGSGMFPLVEIMKNDGFDITGSDVNEGSIIDMERKLGIDVCIGHKAENVDGADAVVVTAALLAGNPEVARAQELGIPVIERADLLGHVTRMFDNAVCVCGTHGKTTTTALLTSVFLNAGPDLDPSAVIGGKLPLINGYGRHGSSDVLVCEACEFKDTFLRLTPDIAVVLNVDADHLDYFGTLEGVIRSFNTFLKMTTKTVIANADDPNTRAALEGVDRPVLTFGETEGCDYLITDVENTERAFFAFTLSRKQADGSYAPLSRFRLSVPGRHNVHNAAAAAAAAYELGADADAIQKGMDTFRGAGRRFELLGCYNGITFADDYAHHPAELEVTLEAAKSMGYDRVIAVFQPFTYSRTKLLLDDFARVLSIADVTVMTEIMGSREVNTFGISTADLAAKIEGSVWFNTFDEVCEHCLSIARPGDLVITLGCGDIYKAANRMVEICRTLNA